MKTLKFKCKLKTDIILNVKSASEGANSTLDFIPGNCFLGIVANKLYGDNRTNDAMEIIHSGKVRFGDAHLADNSKRSLRIPASCFYAKGDSITDACYIHHNINGDPNKIKAQNGSQAQLKQSRSGFYVMTETEGYEVKADKTFAIKSAYDRSERRSKDSAMYGYESLNKGLEMFFYVDLDDSIDSNIILDSLVGERRVGRSRTAQYGLIDIKECQYDDVETYSSNDSVVVYADSRLIFLDKNGLPTFRPNVEQLLGKDAEGKINWEKSQIRTFQYAPWNSTRQCYDTDRCGIEKGSVIVIDGCKKPNLDSCHVGSYKNEGFGRVIFNPIFLQSKDSETGESKCKFHEVKKNDPEDYNYKPSTSMLINFLEKQKSRENKKKNVYREVEDFDETLFIGQQKFISQWGTIRSIALKNKRNDNLKKEIEEYISHGVKQDDWAGKRAELLIDFMEKNESHLWESIINLASEMAKKCRK